jgi:hypothetical protein
MQISADTFISEEKKTPQLKRKFRKEPESISFEELQKELAEVLKHIQFIEETFGKEPFKPQLVSTKPKAKRFFDNIVSKRLARTLLEIRLRLSHSIGSLISFSRSTFAAISLLFGLSNSRVSEILTAYFGTSLSRIPTC